MLSNIHIDFPNKNMKMIGKTILYVIIEGCSSSKRQILYIYIYLAEDHLGPSPSKHRQWPISILLSGSWKNVGVGKNALTDWLRLWCHLVYLGEIVAPPSQKRREN